MANYTLKINNKSYRVDVEEDTPLLWVLRDHPGLVGTKYGCGILPLLVKNTNLNHDAANIRFLQNDKAALSPITNF